MKRAAALVLRPTAVAHGHRNNSATRFAQATRRHVAIANMVALTTAGDTSA